MSSPPYTRGAHTVLGPLEVSARVSQKITEQMMCVPSWRAIAASSAGFSNKAKESFSMGDTQP